MTRLLVLVLVLVLVLESIGRAEDVWPKAAEARFEEARSLSNKGDFAGSARAFREVAEWPEGGDFPQRAQALFCAALQLDSAKDYAGSLRTYREVAERFPKSIFAKRALDEADRLDPPGARGLEFRRRFNEAWEVYSPAIQKPSSTDGVARALGLFEGVLHDHREHPRASDVALAVGDARTRLGDLDGARAALEDAVLLAKREAAKQGAADPAKAGDVVNAELKLAEAKRALLRRWLDRTAKVLLVLALGVFISVRPWRASPRPLLRLAARLLAVDALLALVAVGVAEYVHRYVDDHSPLEDGAAALLVLLPGLVGIIVSLGISNALPGRRGALLGAAVGATAAVAIATMIVYANGLFPFLDSEL